MESKEIEKEIQEQINKANKIKKSEKIFLLVILLIILTLILGITIGIYVSLYNRSKMNTSKSEVDVWFTVNKKTTDNFVNTEDATNIEITYTTKIVKEIIVGNAKYICREQEPEIKGLDENVANKIEEELKKWSSNVWNDIINQNSDESIQQLLTGKDGYYESYEIGFTQSYSVQYANYKVITFIHKLDGGIGGVSWANQSGITFDLKTGDVVNIKDIVSSEKNYVDACKKYVYENLKNDSRYEEIVSLHKDDYEEILNASIEKISGYFIEDGIVCIELPKYSIVSGASGEFKYVVPYYAIKKCIKNEYDFSDLNNKASTIQEIYVDNTKTPGTVRKNR